MMQAFTDTMLAARHSDIDNVALVIIGNGSSLVLAGANTDRRGRVRTVVSGVIGAVSYERLRYVAVMPTYFSVPPQIPPEMSAMVLPVYWVADAIPYAPALASSLYSPSVETAAGYDSDYVSGASAVVPDSAIVFRDGPGRYHELAFIDDYSNLELRDDDIYIDDMLSGKAHPRDYMYGALRVVSRSTTTADAFRRAGLMVDGAGVAWYDSDVGPAGTPDEPLAVVNVGNATDFRRLVMTAYDAGFWHGEDESVLELVYDTESTGRLRMVVESAEGLYTAVVYEIRVRIAKSSGVTERVGDDDNSPCVLRVMRVPTCLLANIVMQMRTFDFEPLTLFMSPNRPLLLRYIMGSHHITVAKEMRESFGDYDDDVTYGAVVDFMVYPLGSAKYSRYMPSLDEFGTTDESGDE